MTTANQPIRIALVGAGIGGLSAAIALTRAGFAVEVFERAPELRASGAGITVQANAMRVMQRLEVADAIAAAGAIIESGSVVNKDGALLQYMDLADVATRLGAPSVAIHRASLLEILADACAAPISTGRCAVDFEHVDAGVELRFEDGASETFDLLIGCDGLHSIVRRRLHGDQPLRYSGYTSWRAACRLDAVGSAAAIATTEYWGRGARFGLVPIGHGELYWFAVKNCAAGGQDAADPRDSLLEIFGDWPAPIADAIAATSPEAILRTDISDRPPLSGAWGSGAVSLLGDAAHPMTPNMGQGACQAIEDAFILAEHLIAHREAGDFAVGLRAYEAARKARTTWFIQQSQRLGGIGQWENAIARSLRDWLMAHAPASAIQRQLARVYDVDF